MMTCIKVANIPSIGEEHHHAQNKRIPRHLGNARMNDERNLGTGRTHVWLTPMSVLLNVLYMLQPLLSLGVTLSHRLVLVLVEHSALMPPVPETCQTKTGDTAQDRHAPDVRKENGSP